MSIENNFSSICLICGGTRLEDFLRIPRVPLSFSFVNLRQDTAKMVERGDIVLTVCHTCGHLFNSRLNPLDFSEVQDCSNPLHYSQFFQNYAHELVQEMIEIYNIRNKRVVDIGCGQGEFLKLICELGSNQGVGIDPIAKSDDGAKNIRFRKETFTASTELPEADLICARQTLEHVLNPVTFLRSVYQKIQHQSEGLIYLEVPNGEWILEERSYWDVIYAHVSYFTKISLHQALQLAGFQVMEIKRRFGGQYLTAIANNRDNLEIKSPEIFNDCDDLSRLVNEFSRDYDKKLAYWSAFMGDAHKNNKIVAVWGAGAKGTQFVNAVDSRCQIPYVIDLNPKKQGGYIVSTGHPIVAPTILLESPADILIIMNKIYQSEIENILNSFDLFPEIVYA